MPAWKFMKKTLSHILFHVYCFHFVISSFITITSSEKALKMCEHNFFQRKIVLLVIYLFNHDSSKPTIFMLNMVFDVILSVVFVK